MGTPCFADRLTLLFEVIRKPRDPSGGERAHYSAEELAAALPRKENGQAVVSANRLRELTRDRNTSPSIKTAFWIAQGWATLAARGGELTSDPTETFAHYLMVDEGNESRLTPDQRDRIEKFHAAFQALLEANEWQGTGIAVLARGGPDLHTPEGQAEARRNLAAALRLDDSLRERGGAGSSLWNRLLGRRGNGA